jgi:phage shock protein A
MAQPSTSTSSAPPAPKEESENNTVDLTEESPEDGDNGKSALTQNLEEHYKGLCTQLTKKVEKLHNKAERRKQEYNEVVQKNKLLELQVEEMRRRIKSLEMQLGSK